MRHFLTAAALGLALSATQARAQEEMPSDAVLNFVEANLLSIFYHELGHALIDLAGVPIYGQEEDAADVLSVLMIDQLFDPEVADDIAWDAALTYLLDAEMAEGEGAEIAYWDVHGLDAQRYYTLICLHYGADPEGRAALAEEAGLPEERAEYCEDERAQAEDAWGAVLDEMDNPDKRSNWVSFFDNAGESDVLTDLTAELLEAEVTALNDWLDLGAPLKVTLESCGEANAFYDPEASTIIMCTEFAPYLAEQIKRTENS